MHCLCRRHWRYRMWFSW